MTSSKLKIVLFLSSVRPNRLAERVGIYLVEAITAKGMEPVLFDPLEMQFEIVQLPIYFMTNPEHAPEWLKEAHDKIRTADAFLIASAEYNCAMPPALTNMLHHFSPAAFRNRPCGILTYAHGPFGGIRVETLLRVFVAEFGMLPVPTSVVIPTVQKCISKEGILDEERVSWEIGKQLDEIAWFATAFKNYTAVVAPPS